MTSYPVRPERLGGVEAEGLEALAPLLSGGTAACHGVAVRGEISFLY